MKNIKFEKEVQKPVIVRFEESLVERIDKERKKIGITRKKYIELCVLEHLARSTK